MPNDAAAQLFPIVSNRPYHRGSKLHELFEPGELSTHWTNVRAGDVAGMHDDYMTACVLSACPRTRVRFLQAIYDEMYADNAVLIAYNVIARSADQFGKVIDWRSVAARERVNLVVMGARAALSAVTEVKT